jgi:hypothetical protein
LALINTREPEMDPVERDDRPLPAELEA